MKPSTLYGGLSAVVMLVLAGCTGNFEVQQTEPFRVQIDGAPHTVVVSEDDDDPKEVVVDPCDTTCRDDADNRVNVKVQVKQVSEGPCMVKVIIKEKSTGRVLEEREIDGSGDSDDDSVNGTGSGQVVVQNFFVNVKGKENIVVLTQALQGSANVDVSAARASGNADASVGDDDDDTSSTTTTTSGNMTSSTTSTTGP